MFGRVIVGEVIREAKSGRTRPVVMLCEADTDGAVEVFCKLSAGCFEGVTSLAREAVAACLATDLNLPVPTPYLVEIPSSLASVVTDPDIAERLGASSPVGFGSAKVENQFSVWTSGNRVTDVMLPSALGLSSSMPSSTTPTESHRTPTASYPGTAFASSTTNSRSLRHRDYLIGGLPVRPVP